MERQVVNSKQSLVDIIRLLTQMQKEFGYFEIDIVNVGGTRTDTQNKALHLWCSMISKTLNDAGLDMTKALSHHADIPWDKEGINVKQRIFKPIQESLTGKQSTRDANRVEYNQVAEVIIRHFAGLGVELPPWPSKEKK